MTSKKHRRIFAMIAAVSAGITLFSEEIYYAMFNSSSLLEICLGCMTFLDLLILLNYTFPIIVFGLFGTALSYTRLFGTRVVMVTYAVGVVFVAYWYIVPYMTYVHGLSDCIAFVCLN